MKGLQFLKRSKLNSLLLISFFIICLPVNTLANGDQEPDKKHRINARIPGNYLQNNAQVRYTHTGSIDGRCPVQTFNGQSNFVLGTGQMERVSSLLCDQELTSQWDIVGALSTFRPPSGELRLRTGFRQLKEDKRAFILSDAKVKAFGPEKENVGRASSVTTFRVDALIADELPVFITEAGSDDAYVGGSNVLEAEASGRTAILQNNSPLLDANTSLFSTNGGTGFLNDKGLTLLNRPNSTLPSTSGYNVSAINYNNSSQNLIYSILLSDGILTTSGISQSLFQTIFNGYFLPIEDLLTVDLVTTTLGGITVEATATAREAKVVVSEPRALMPLLTSLVLFGVIKFRFRKRKTSL